MIFVILHHYKLVMFSLLHRNEERRKLMQSIGCNATADGNEVARNSDIIILATKPDGVGKALTDAKPFITKDKLVISICAGVSASGSDPFIPRRCSCPNFAAHRPLRKHRGAR
jgi:pyrroline-5-carboxylate reductase